MYIFYDTNSLNILSMVGDDVYNLNKQSNTIKSMFPDNKNVSAWFVDKKVKFSKDLKISLDKDGNPKTLLLDKKVVYKESEANKKRKEKEFTKLRSEKIGRAISKRLARSIDKNLINYWVKSPLTKPNISKSISSGEYFLKNKIIPVSWWGTFTDAGGYANMNRSIVSRLHNHHVVSKIDIAPTAVQISPQSQYMVSKYSSLDFSSIKKHVKIFGFTPIPHVHNGYKIFYTMMETETLHPEFARLCNQADEIWVPSKHNKRVFKKAGVNKEITVMPLGIDETLYPINDVKVNRNKHVRGLMPIFNGGSKTPKNFRFFSLFGWSFRKGPDLLIRSFVKAFDSSDDVCLIIAARHCGSSAKNHIDIVRNEMIRYAHSVRTENLPQIYLYPHIIPEEEMLETYKMGDVFICTSRGEGFSLPQIEAAACGLPVISCNNTGMSEYLTEENSFIIPNKQFEVCNPEMHWITHYYHGQLFPKLGKEETNITVKHMKYVYNNYDKAKKKAKILKDLVFGQYTWEKATKRIALRLKTISS